MWFLPKFDFANSNFAIGLIQMAARLLIWRLHFFIISNGRKTDHLETTYLPKAIDTFLAYLLGGNAFFIPVFRMLGESPGIVGMAFH